MQLPVTSLSITGATVEAEGTIGVIIITADGHATWDQGGFIETPGGKLEQGTYDAKRDQETHPRPETNSPTICRGSAFLSRLVRALARHVDRAAFRREIDSPPAVLQSLVKNPPNGLAQSLIGGPEKGIPPDPN